MNKLAFAVAAVLMAGCSGSDGDTSGPDAAPLAADARAGYMPAADACAEYAVAACACYNPDVPAQACEPVTAEECRDAATARGVDEVAQSGVDACVWSLSGSVCDPPVTLTDECAWTR